MEIHLIWAQDCNGGIGIDGKLPWHITEDLKNFKKLTENSIIIMGRKTWDSLPKKPLPKRHNIILSRTLDDVPNVYSSFDKCIKNLNNNNVEKVFVIGGRSIYKIFFNLADFLHITQINIIQSGINEFFPLAINEIEKKFIKVSEKKISPKANYTFWEKIINNY